MSTLKRMTPAALVAAALLFSACASGRLEGEGQIKVDFWTGNTPDPASVARAAFVAPGLGHIGRGNHQGRQDKNQKPAALPEENPSQQIAPQKPQTSPD